jgi:hypothetical protein
MMRIRKARVRAFHAQRGHCFYCGLPMAIDKDGLKSFAEHHGLKAREARQMLATAEHLTAKCDGGKDTRDNIVAAHNICNARRHRSLTPKAAQAFREHVMQRCSRGRWHGHKILKLKPNPCH